MVTPLKGSAVFVQCSGATAAANASVAGAVQEAGRADCIDKLLAAHNGMLGVLGEDLFDLRKERADDIENLKRSPSAALGSGGCPFAPGADAERALEVLRAHNVRYFFCAGGCDSMAAAEAIDRLAAAAGYELRVVGLPQSADNDLPGTDHCPGYGSAAKFAAATALSAGRCAEALASSAACLVLELPGRGTGWLSAAAGLARRSPEDAPHLVYLPERPVSLPAVARDVRGCLDEFRRCVVAVSEGARNEKGEPLAGAGAGDFLRALIERELGVRCLSDRPGTAVRAGMHFASLADVSEAVEAGSAAVRKAIAGQSGAMISLLRESGPAYRCSTGTVRLSDVVAGGPRGLPAEFLAGPGQGTTDAFRDYAKPLMRGEAPINVGPDGLPVYVRLQKRFVPKALAQWAPAAAGKF